MASKVKAATLYAYGSETATKKAVMAITVPGGGAHNASAEWTGTAAEWRLVAALNPGTLTVKALEELTFTISKLASSNHPLLFAVVLVVELENTEKFSLFPKEVTTNEWSVIGGGTVLEAIKKEVTPPGETPSTTKSLESPVTEGSKVVGLFTISGALIAAIGEAGSSAKPLAMML